MGHDTNSLDSGTVPDPTTPTSTDAAEILRVVEQNTKAFGRVRDVLVALDARLEAIERTLKGRRS